MAYVNLDDLLREGDDCEIADKCLMHFKHTTKESKKFMKLLVTKLPEMEISWELPWYQKYKIISRPVNVDENDELEGESFRTDRFSKAESDIIGENWKTFVKIFNVPDTPHYYTGYKRLAKNFNKPYEKKIYRVRYFITAFLARGLKRELFRVHKDFKRKYSFTRTGKYTKKEERIVEICAQHFPENACKVLSCILGREPRNLYNKIDEVLQRKDEHIRPKPWTLKRSSRFLKYLLRFTDLPLSELKNRRLDYTIWHKIGARMKRSSQNVREYWYHRLHVQLFVEEDIKYHELRRKIITKLQASSYQIWRDINWIELAKEFPDGCTSDFIYEIVARILKNDNYQYFKKPLEEIINFAFRKIDSSTRKNMRLKQLRLKEDGTLEPYRKTKNSKENYAPENMQN